MLALFQVVCECFDSIRSKLTRDKDRDITEQVALGMPSKATVTHDSLFDQRLFGQTKVRYSVIECGRDVLVRNVHLGSCLLWRDFGIYSLYIHTYVQYILCMYVQTYMHMFTQYLWKCADRFEV